MDRGASDFLDDFRADLKPGENILLVKVCECGGGWSMFVGFSNQDDDLDFNLELPGPGFAVKPSGEL